MNNIKSLFDAEKIAAEVERKAPEAARQSFAWRLANHDRIAEAVARLDYEARRLGYVLAVLESDEVRAAFKAFDGKIINKRLWDAVSKACEIAAPVGEPWQRGNGEIVQQCAQLCPGGDYNFGVIYIPGYSDNYKVYKRFSDYSETTRGDEYQANTGDRLDAARALAVLEYDAAKVRATLESIEADAEKIPDIIAQYLKGAQMIADACSGVNWKTREAFNLGRRDTLPVVIHN